jgi:hypothetical protein
LGQTNVSFANVDYISFVEPNADGSDSALLTQNWMYDVMTSSPSIAAIARDPMGRMLVVHETINNAWWTSVESSVYSDSLMKKIHISTDRSGTEWVADTEAALGPLASPLMFSNSHGEIFVVGSARLPVTIPPNDLYISKLLTVTDDCFTGTGACTHWSDPVRITSGMNVHIQNTRVEVSNGKIVLSFENVDLGEYADADQRTVYVTSRLMYTWSIVVIQCDDLPGDSLLDPHHWGVYEMNQYNATGYPLRPSVVPKPGEAFLFESLPIRAQHKGAGGEIRVLSRTMTMQANANMAAVSEFRPERGTLDFVEYREIPGFAIAHGAVGWCEQEQVYWMFGNIGRDSDREWKYEQMMFAAMTPLRGFHTQVDRSALGLYASSNLKDWILLDVIVSAEDFSRSIMYPNVYADPNCKLHVVGRASLTKDIRHGNHNTKQIVYFPVELSKYAHTFDWIRFKGVYTQ